MAQEKIAPDQASQIAQRMVQHQGWYKTGKGWEQLGPDVADKINLRVAEPQPNGKYLIRDVDVFYPNAVKGQNSDVMYDADKIRGIIKNTNASIGSGGQKPS